MAREDTIDRKGNGPRDSHDEHERSGGLHDEPRIVKAKRSARAGDRHRENLHALLIGGGAVALAFVILYFLFFV